MTRLRLVLLVLLALLIPALAVAGEAMPQVGQMAPGFRLQDQNGHWKSLAEYRGQWLVLYFYPKDFTPGCTTEVCKYRDSYMALRREGEEVSAWTFLRVGFVAMPVALLLAVLTLR